MRIIDPYYLLTTLTIVVGISVLTYMYNIIKKLGNSDLLRKEAIMLLLLAQKSIPFYWPINLSNYNSHH